MLCMHGIWLYLGHLNDQAQTKFKEIKLATSEYKLYGCDIMCEEGMTFMLVYSLQNQGI